MNHAAASAPPLAASALPLPLADSLADSPADSPADLPAYWLGTPAMLGCLLGVALQLQQPALSAPLVYGLLLLAGCALAGLALLPGAGRARWVGVGPCGWRQAGRWLAMLLGAAALLAGLCGLRALAFASQALDPALQGRDLRVTALVTAMPQPRADGWRLRLAPESAYLADAPAHPVRLPPLLDVSWYADGREAADRPPPPTLRAGERWQLTLRLKAPHGARNPQGFDYELWLWEQGVQATGYVRAGPAQAAPQRLAATWQYPVEQLRQRVRDAIWQRLGAGPAQLEVQADMQADMQAETGAETQADAARRRAAGVVVALVTGDQRAIDRADWDIFRITGVAHLMSISGLHITLFAWLAAALLQAAWRRSARLCLCWPAPQAALVGGVLLAAGYALFSGWGVPAQRTVWMLASVALLRLSGRRWPWPQVWLLACTVVLLADPWALLQAGFWLSFVAIGILFATDLGAVPHGQSRAIGYFVSVLREQWVVTVALSPLTLLLFGQMSVVGLLANLLAIPWTTLVLTPLALLGLLWSPLWQATAWCAQLLGLWLQWLAAWPGAQLTLPAAPLVLGLAALCGALLLVLRLPWGWRLLGLPLLLPLLLWQPLRPPPGQFELLAADVGQGQAVLVQTASHSLLYDAGPRYSSSSDAGERVLVPLLQALGARLDWLLLSHGDSDHTGGAAALLAQQPQARVLGSIDPGRLPVSVQPCQAGQRWQWDGVWFTILHPAPPADPAAAGPARKGRTNARSCVLRIQDAAGRAALLVGDIERAQEAELVASGADLAADWLLVPHHGSKTSSSPAFLDAVRPRLGLVQAGWRNRFGHPAPEVVQRYQERGIALAQTPLCGAARWSSGDARLDCQRVAGQRYWQQPGQLPR